MDTDLPVIVFPSHNPQHETAHVIWSWNDNDPVNNIPSFHQLQGATSLNLLGGLVDPPQDPPDAQTFALTVNNVRKQFIKRTT